MSVPVTFCRVLGVKAVGRGYGSAAHHFEALAIKRARVRRVRADCLRALSVIFWREIDISDGFGAVFGQMILN